MLPSDMLVQLPETLEECFLLTERTLVVQHHGVLVLDLLRLETHFELPVHGVDVVLHVLELGFSHGEDNLKMAEYYEYISIISTVPWGGPFYI